MRPNDMTTTTDTTPPRLVTLYRRIQAHDHAHRGGATRSIEGAARDYLRTPDGGWGETEQASRLLDDACHGTGISPKDALLAVERCTDVTLHPSRIRYTARRGADGWSVADREGGVWWPSEEAASDIAASDRPAATAVAICTTSPMRGTWHD